MKMHTSLAEETRERVSASPFTALPQPPYRGGMPTIPVVLEDVDTHTVIDEEDGLIEMTILVDREVADR